MARARTIKPGFFKNEKLASCAPHARLMFVGLWTLADRNGRVEDRPARIKAEIFPYEDVDIESLLESLCAAPDPFILRYESGGVKVIQVVKWEQHQSPHVREPDSALPACKPKSGRTHARMIPDSLQPVSSRKRERGKGNRELEGECKGETKLPAVLDTPEFCAALDAWREHRRQAYSDRGLAIMIGQAAKRAEAHGVASVVGALELAISNGWKGWNFDSSFGGNVNGRRRRNDIGPGQRFDQATAGSSPIVGGF